jgi:8-oxo-dGTP diphosphatase
MEEGRLHMADVVSRSLGRGLLRTPWRGSQIPALDGYLRMKKHLLLQELRAASPGAGGRAEPRILGSGEGINATGFAVTLPWSPEVPSSRKPSESPEEEGRPPAPRFCSACGSPLSEREIEGRRRAICTECGYIAYQNPLPVVAAVVVSERDQLLLVRRGREPLKGLWCLPCGFAEKDEEIEEAVLRELREETNLAGTVTRLLDAAANPSDFYGSLLMISYEIGNVVGAPAPGDDAEDARYFRLDRRPPLAFSSHEAAVRKYVELNT